MKLTGKTLEEIAAALVRVDREGLLTLIHSLVTLEKLYSARQIAEMEGCNKRDVLSDMKAGRFVDPIYGAGFFVRARNSFRVTGSAVAAWRRSCFVRARRQDVLEADSIPLEKNKRAASENDVNGEKPGQRRHAPELVAAVADMIKNGDL